MSIVKLNNRAVSNATTFGSISSLGEMVFISKATASSSASIEFTLGDYKEYQFYFVNCHPQTDNVDFTFQTSIDNGSTYGVTTTSTYFVAVQEEDSDPALLTYVADFDLAQSTNFQILHHDIGNDNDQNNNGCLKLFNPSSLTYVKHYIYSGNASGWLDATQNSFVSGYFNDTNDLTNIKFQYSSGNIDAGSILMFGIN